MGLLHYDSLRPSHWGWQHSVPHQPASLFHELNPKVSRLMSAADWLQLDVTVAH